MKRIINLGWGGFLIFFGTGLLAWIAYNYLVEMQPEAEGRSPIEPAIFGVTTIVIGIARIRGRTQSGVVAEAEENVAVETARESQAGGGEPNDRA